MTLAVVAITTPTDTYLIRFDAPSLPLAIAKINALLNNGTIDDQTACFLSESAVEMAQELERMG